MIVSVNMYFLLGVGLLYKSIELDKFNDVVIFDMEGYGIYLMNKRELGKFTTTDSFKAFIHCREFIVRKHEINKFILKLPVSNRAVNNELNNKLTSCEIYILENFCKGVSVKHLSALLGMSEKVISAHKINGLRKLDLANVNLLFLEYNLWEVLWGAYNNLFCCRR
ncbi:hypothetical protein CU955_09270 [Salmonella enterica]|nr:hypothetical protein [Salmonella enterica]